MCAMELFIPGSQLTNEVMVVTLTLHSNPFCPLQFIHSCITTADVGVQWYLSHFLGQAHSKPPHLTPRCREGGGVPCNLT